MSGRQSPSAELRARVLAAAATAPARTRAEVRARARRVALPLLALLALLVVGQGVSLGARPPWLVAASVLVPLAIAVAALVGIRTPRSMVGPPRIVLAAATLVPMTALVLLAFGVAWFGPAVAAELTSGSIDGACFGLALVQGALPLGAFVALRRGDAATPTWVGAALGASAGALTAAAAAARCPHGALWHVLLAHVSPVAVLVGLGAMGFAWVSRLRDSTETAARPGS